jgi:hypothetical protein
MIQDIGLEGYWGLPFLGWVCQVCQKTELDKFNQADSIHRRCVAAGAAAGA